MKYENIRFAKLEDIPALMEMAQKLYVGSPYEVFKINQAKVRAALEKFVVEGQKDFLVLVAEVENKPVGVLAAYAFQPLFSDDRAAIEALWFVEPEQRKGNLGQQMMDAFEYWAQTVAHAKVVQYGYLSSSPPGMEKLYERRHLVKAEVIYMGVFE